MSESVEKLKAALLELPEAERLAIADFLYASLPPPGVLSADDPEFDALLDRRLADLESGRVKGVPAEEVMARLRKKYAR